MLDPKEKKSCVNCSISFMTPALLTLSSALFQYWPVSLSRQQCSTFASCVIYEWDITMRSGSKPLPSRALSSGQWNASDFNMNNVVLSCTHRSHECARWDGLGIQGGSIVQLNLFCKFGHSVTRHQNTQYNHVTPLKTSHNVQKQLPRVSNRCPRCVSLMFLYEHNKN